MILDAHRCIERKYTMDQNTYSELVKNRQRSASVMSVSFHKHGRYKCHLMRRISGLEVHSSSPYHYYHYHIIHDRRICCVQPLEDFCSIDMHILI